MSDLTERVDAAFAREMSDRERRDLAAKIVDEMERRRLTGERVNLTADDVAQMSPEQIVDARRAGRLDHLLTDTEGA